MAVLWVCRQAGRQASFLVCRQAGRQAFWVVVLLKEGWFGPPQTCLLSRSPSQCLCLALGLSRAGFFVGGCSMSV